jgi:hypothetical protein
MYDTSNTVCEYSLSELNSQFRLIGHSEQTVVLSNQQSFTFNLILLSEKI